MKTIRRQSRRSVFLRRLAAVGFSFLLLALVELILRIFVPAPRIILDDPFVSFSELSPLFVLDSSGSRFVIGKER